MERWGRSNVSSRMMFKRLLTDRHEITIKQINSTMQQFLLSCRPSISMLFSRFLVSPFPTTSIRFSMPTLSQYSSAIANPSSFKLINHTLPHRLKAIYFVPIGYPYPTSIPYPSRRGLIGDHLFYYTSMVELKFGNNMG
ncbi:hypothetical protein FEM48_Zijuj06G0134300 [Ziziphus jujuba var. spinosa]|uniref:Uncharacterized protein n=1 Tax=Ziziphus jujuba var. spinosa TaxID=714518 RepID=A0A978V9J2_ZIZJJ|nr:hypothetical protein FEM48_Zijuj06G0134300 [Ziziphus jujuba var. spinosa]